MQQSYEGRPRLFILVQSHINLLDLVRYELLSGPSVDGSDVTFLEVPQ
jgi:hypothetical protein